MLEGLGHIIQQDLDTLTLLSSDEAPSFKCPWEPSSVRGSHPAASPGLGPGCPGISGHGEAAKKPSQH